MTTMTSATRLANMTLLGALLSSGTAIGAQTEATHSTTQSLTMIRADKSPINDSSLSRILGTLQTLDQRNMPSGLRVEVMTYNAEFAKCPKEIMNAEDENPTCQILLISAWVDLEAATTYALWQASLPRYYWKMAKDQPKQDQPYGDFVRILLSCEKVQNTKEKRPANEEESVYEGIPYQLRVGYTAEPVPGQNYSAPAYKATLERVTEPALQGRHFDCIGNTLR